MRTLKIISNDSEMNLGDRWQESKNCKSINRIVDAKGRSIKPGYAGNRYEIILKKERSLPLCERFCRILLATAAVVCSLFLALISKSIRDLFTKQKLCIHFAKRIDLSHNGSDQKRAVQEHVLQSENSQISNNPSSQTANPTPDSPPELPLTITTPTPSIIPVQEPSKQEPLKNDIVNNVPPDTKSEELNKPAPLVDKPSETHPRIPVPPEGIITNGYGEYLIYRIDNGQKEPISKEEYLKVFDIIENCRSLKEDQIPENMHDYLTGEIQKNLGKEVHLAFIPRTMYELIFLKECIQEDIDKKETCNPDRTGILLFVKCPIIGETLTTNDDADLMDPAFHHKSVEEKKSTIKSALEKGFWQHCIYEDHDYKKKFKKMNEFDYRQDHLKCVAAKLNQVALDYFKEYNSTGEGFTFKEIADVQNKLIKFFKDLTNPDLEIHKKAASVGRLGRAGISKIFSKEANTNNQSNPEFPLGIATERHEQIVKNSIQLECSARAVNNLILYRGSNFSKDSLTKNVSIYPNTSVYPNSLSYGASPFSGGPNDGGATAFHYMRKPYSDAYAIVVPLKEQQANATPFHTHNVHPLIQVGSRGEIFHDRTKIWDLKPDDQVLGFFGVSKIKYSSMDECCKTSMSKEEIEKAFQKFKDEAYILAPKEA